MTPSQKILDPFFTIIQGQLQQSTANIPPGSYLDRVYKFTDGAINYYRILYRSPRGYSQYTFIVERVSSSITASSVAGFMVNNGDTELNLKRDKIPDSVLTYAETINPSLKGS